MRSDGGTSPRAMPTSVFPDAATILPLGSNIARLSQHRAAVHQPASEELHGHEGDPRRQLRHAANRRLKVPETNKGTHSETDQILVRYLIDSAEIARLERDECLVLITGLPPFRPRNMT